MKAIIPNKTPFAYYRSTKQHHHHKSSSLLPVFTIITTIISNVICNYLFIIFTLVLFQGLFEPSYTFFTLIVLHILFFLVLSYLILVWFGTSWWSVTLSIFVFACGQVRNPRLIAFVSLSICTMKHL